VYKLSKFCEAVKFLTCSEGVRVSSLDPVTDYSDWTI